MLTAKQARSAASPKCSEPKASIETLRASIDAAVTKASKDGNHSTSLVVSGGFDPGVFGTVRGSLRKLGYTVKVELHKGTLDTGLYVAPKVVLNLYW